MFSFLSRVAGLIALAACLCLVAPTPACPVAAAVAVPTAVPVVQAVPFATLAVETQPVVAVQTFSAFTTFATPVLNVATPVNVLNVNVRARGRALPALPARTNVNVRVRSR